MGLSFATLIDGFDTTVDPAVWYTSGASVVAGKVVLTAGELSTVATYDLTGAQVTVHLVDVNLTAPVEVRVHDVFNVDELSVTLQPGAGASLAHWIRYTGGPWGDTATFTFDPYDCAYIRFREDVSGVAVIETSPDTLTWTTRATSAAGMVLTDAMLFVDGTVGVDSVNVDPPVLAACGPTVKAAQLQDAFDAGLSNPRWIIDSGTVEAGSGKVAAASSTVSPVRFHWQCPVDLTDSAMYIKVAPDVYLNTYYHFKMMADANNYVAFVCVGPNPDALRFRMCKAGVVTDTFVDYDPTRHAWWKLAEAGGALHWDVGSNGQSWVNQRVAAHGMDLALVSVVFESGAHALHSGFGGALFGIGHPGFGD